MSKKETGKNDKSNKCNIRARIMFRMQMQVYARGGFDPGSRGW